MVGFFYVLWQRRLQAGRELIYILSQNLPVEQLVPTYQTLWETLCVGRTWSLGIVCSLLNSAQRSTLRLLSNLRYELDMAVSNAIQWTYCSLAIAHQIAYKVILKAIIYQLISTLLVNCLDRLWTVICEGYETLLAFQELLTYHIQYQNPSRTTVTKEASTYRHLGTHSRPSQHILRPHQSTASACSQTVYFPTSYTNTGENGCDMRAKGKSQNTRFQDGMKEKETPSTSSPNIDQEMKRLCNAIILGYLYTICLLMQMMQ
ncbi:uncharacterized protein LOC127542815 [Antechinus flavipes]|uniref:uncharacterized protein LOC127542815 n=1 Tax=Antechinus flavipes TaxID=38775 RepID=UPI00223585CC|nr:uncharacterized protein LOC127542815 [Antechinus flavipes]